MTRIVQGGDGALAGQTLPALTDADTPTTVNNVSTAYNADSQISSIGDNYSHYAYTFDGQGNTATVDNSGTPGVPDVVLASQYDAMGNRTSLSASIAGVKDFMNSYSYDALSRLYDVIQQGQTGGNAVAPKQVYYKLDGIGNVTEIDRSTSLTVGANPNGFANSVLSYNTLGQLTGINHESGGVSVDDLTYSYDGIGRVATFGSVDGTATYGYDPMSQLVSATYAAANGHTEPPNLSLSFDNNGNRTSVNGTGTTVAPGNHLANDGTFTFAYDGAGNLITRTRISDASANDYRVNYTWDTANRLVEVQDFNNSGTLTQQINYTYDVYGRLIERVDDVVGGATTTVHYGWDGDGMVLAFDGNGNLTTRYLNGPSTSAYDQYFATLAQEDVTSPTQQGTTSWPELDAQGSVVDIASNTGAIIDHIEYTATGTVFSESNPSVTHIGSFQGGYLDSATGFEKFGDRWEEMADAVWASEDPIDFSGGSMNLSEAVGNDPANAIDPSGLIDIDIPKADESATSPRNPAERRDATYGPSSKNWNWGPKDGSFISQRVTIEGTLSIVDGCGDTHSVSFQESYIEVWTVGGTHQESHTAGPRKPAGYLKKLGAFGFGTPGGSRVTINYGDHSCEVQSWDFRMTAKYEVTSGNYGLNDGGFYKSPNQFKITKASVAGTAIANPAPEKGVFESMQYPKIGTVVPGLTYPPPQPKNAVELAKDAMPLLPGAQFAGQVFAADRREYIDTDTWHFHWQRGAAKATKQYTSTGYQPK